MGVEMCRNATTLHLHHVSFATASKDLIKLTVTLRNYSIKKKIERKKYCSDEMAQKMDKFLSKKG